MSLLLHIGMTKPLTQKIWNPEGLFVYLRYKKKDKGYGGERNQRQD